MKDKYIDLINQTFEFPQDEFRVEDGKLYFHDINMMDIIDQYGTPLKITYLPKISSQIQKAKRMFNVAMAKVDYKGSYHYCYCTKSSHFEFVLREAMKNDIHLETSSAFDLNLIEDFVEALAHPGERLRTAIDHSVESHRICFEAERSRLTGQTITLERDEYGLKC